MIVEAKFSSSNIAGKLRDGAYELPEGATVAELIEAAQSESGYMLTEEDKETLVFIFNNSPASYDTGLCHGGKLRVLFKVMGG